MDINIKHTDCLNVGAYILNDKKVPCFPYKECSSVFLTQENNTILKDEIIGIINNSKEVLKVCSFIITDHEIFEKILYKAQNTNTAIFILTQLDKTKLTNSVSLLDYLTEEEIKENSSQTHLKHIKKLYDNGVHIRASTSIHAKFLISDRKIGFITSANLTTASLTFNTESGVYLNDISSTELDRLFDIIYQKGTNYRQFISTSKKNKIIIAQSQDNIDIKLLPNPSKSSLRYTYGNETNNLYENILQIIKEAKAFLYISTFSIVELNSLNEFVTAIKEASNRGVKIRIFCRGMNFRNDHLKGSEILHSSGCQIFADISNHSKGIINEKNGLIFTANIDGNYGLKNGFEVGYILDEPQRLEFLRIHKYLIETSFYIYQSKSPRIELFKTYIVYEMIKKMHPPIFPNNIVITIKSDLKVNQNELKEKPLFYGKSKNGEYIIAGNSFYKCKKKDSTFLIFDKDHPHFDIERYIIKFINLKIIFNE